MRVGPSARAVGKTTAFSRKAATVIEPDVQAQAAAFKADPDAALRDLEEPVLLDVLDTFVAAQLRPELAISARRPRPHHLRTERGRREIDLLVELGGGRVVGLEVKAAAAVDSADARHLIWLRDALGERFLAGAVLHTGPDVYLLDGRIVAAPIATLWNA